MDFDVDKIKKKAEFINGYVGREWTYVRIPTPGWSNGSQDIEIWVQTGSPSKAMIIYDNGRQKAWLYMDGQPRRVYSNY